MDTKRCLLYTPFTPFHTIPLRLDAAMRLLLLLLCALACTTATLACTTTLSLSASNATTCASRQVYACLDVPGPVLVLTYADDACIVLLNATSVPEGVCDPQSGNAYTCTSATPLTFAELTLDVPLVQLASCDPEATAVTTYYTAESCAYVCDADGVVQRIASNSTDCATPTTAVATDTCASTSDTQYSCIQAPTSNDGAASASVSVIVFALVLVAASLL